MTREELEYAIAEARRDYEIAEARYNEAMAEVAPYEAAMEDAEIRLTELEDALEKMDEEEDA
jgi:hypothetical protein